MIAALIALIALLMLGGAAGTGWTADLEKPVKKQLDDKTRREAVLDALDDYEEGMDGISDSLQEHFTDLLKSHIDFQSSENTFDAVAEKLNSCETPPSTGVSSTTVSISATAIVSVGLPLEFPSGYSTSAT